MPITVDCTTALTCDIYVNSPPCYCIRANKKVVKLKNIPPKEQEACRNEVELLQRMTHPNIVGYTNSFLYKNCLCIIMEYCDAGDLGDRVNEAKVCVLVNIYIYIYTQPVVYVF